MIIDEIMIAQLAYQVITLSWNFLISRMAMLPAAEVKALNTYSAYIMLTMMILFERLPDPLPYFSTSIMDIARQTCNIIMMTSKTLMPSPRWK